MDWSLQNYLLLWVCVFGLCFGSFFNVVILRSLSGESIVFPGSKCPKCGNRLKAWHNIPVLSYVLLGGKCAFCKDKISLQYPIIELFTMILFAVTFLKWGFDLKTLFVIIISSCVLIMTVTDIKEKLVDCNIAIGLASFGVLYNGFLNGYWLDSVLGLVVGIAIMELLAWSGYLFTKNRAFGEADTYVVAALGACFGLKALPEVLLYSLIASMFFVFPAFWYKQYRNGNKLLCVLFILFILAILVFKTLYQNYLSFSIVTLLGVLLVFSILKGLHKEASPLYLPLVPAFALGTLYFLFF